MVKNYQRRTFGEFLRGEPKREIRSEPLPGVLPPDRSSRTSVTVNESLSISAVYASVNILNNWTAAMDLGVWRGSEELPAPSIIATPEYGSSQYQFVKKTVTSLALTGNAFWFITRRQSDGVALNLDVLNPFEVQVAHNNAGRIVYLYNGKTYTARNISHVQTFAIPGRLTGLSPIEAAGAGMAAVLDLRAYANDWFGGSGAVRQHITTTRSMDEYEFAEYKRRVAENKRENNGDLITDADTSIQNLSLNPAEALYMEQQQFTVTDIARWFGIPAYLVLASVDGNSMTYSNLQTDARLFVTSTLSGYMRPIEEALTALLPRGQVVRFRTEALLRADTRDRYEANNVALAGRAWKTVNEVRAEEGRPPVEGGDVLAEPVAVEPVAEPNSTEGDSNEES